MAMARVSGWQQAAAVHPSDLRRNALRFIPDQLSSQCFNVLRAEERILDDSRG
jgi:hypothetical protein